MELRLDFGIQYSMVSGKNGLFVWVYSVMELRLDFGIQYSMHTNKPFLPLTIEYWIPKSNLNPTTLYTHTNKPFSSLTIEYWIPKSNLNPTTLYTHTNRIKVRLWYPVLNGKW
jgi:hypothetical protein